MNGYESPGAAKLKAKREAQKNGHNQVIVRREDGRYIPIDREQCPIQRCEAIVEALGGEVVDEIIVLK